MASYRFSSSSRLGSPAPRPGPTQLRYRCAQRRHVPGGSRANHPGPLEIEPRLRVLYIEDNPDDARFVSEIISSNPERPVELSIAENLNEGVDALQRSRPDVVLLDLFLPDVTGIDTVQAVVRSNPEVPLVVLTGTDDEQLALRAVHAGAQDYLVKNDLEASILLRTLRHAIERQRLVLELKRLHARAYHHATHDALTGLGNRQLLLETLRQALDRAQRYGDLLAVLFVDIDGFKLYNDASGHTEGDRLLKRVGEVLRSAVRRSDFVARLGGDEFVVVLPRIMRAQNAAHVAQNILSNFGELRTTAGDVDVTLSIGVTIFPVDGADEQLMLRRADLAMYAVKRNGGDGFHFYSAAIEAEGSRRMTLEADLAEAVSLKQLALSYQPVIDAERKVVRGVEALLRWRHPRLGLVPPAEFVPIAEETGRIASIGEWTLEEACRQLRDWRADALPDLQMAVNVSQKQLGENGLVEKIEGVLRQNAVEAAALTIEVTESGIAKDMERAIYVLGQLKELGVTVFIDDFGTGYSSLEALSRLPVDGLKIDRSFLQGLRVRDKNVPIVEAILAMARTLHLEVVAEGVETADELAFLRERRCRFLQGHYFSRPLPPGELPSALSLGLPL